MPSDDTFLLPVAMVLGFFGFILLLIVLALLGKLPEDEVGY